VNLGVLHMQSADPTHLPLYWTNNILLHIGSNVLNCCIIGFHGAGEVNGHGTGSVNGNANQPVQTFAWASWITPGTYPRVAGRPLPTDWAIQDIQALSHEISEWADDPFVNNLVEPWQTPTAPQYGCSSYLETGDPVGGYDLAPVSSANGVVYAGGDGGTVFAFLAATGAKLWSHQIGAAGSPAVVNGKVYIGSADHNIYAFGLP